MPRRVAIATSGIQDGLLRSINVAFDADYPDRVAHFRPTSKSVQVLRALLGQLPQKAFLVTAPYGSGKSLVAAYALHVIENGADTRSALGVVTERLRSLAPGLASPIEARARRRSAKGLVLAIQGAQLDLSAALAEAANASFRRSRKGKGGGRPRSVQPLPDPIKTLRAVLDTAAAGELDSVLLVWDEFGRHLEELLASGRAAELSYLQTIAELAARNDSLPFSVVLLTHRGLGQYSSTAPQAIRTEWAKVEGRFHAIQYIDDSKEMYRLIAGTVAERRPIAPSVTQRNWLRKTAKAIRAAGVFRDLSSEALFGLVESAFPIHPLALYVLPRVAARISQNERTIFSFLSEERSGRPVGLSQVYDYFADSMRADTAAGGAHRQYLETETAIRRATSHEAADALKAACLLGLGLVGERGQVSRDLLCAAISRFEKTNDAAEIVKSLIESKLLLFRPHSADVSVWHGADIDLRGALESEKERHRSGFNVLGFLRKELPPPTWRPVEFNDDFHIKRFLSGRYLTPSQFLALCESPKTARQEQDSADGVILFVLAENATDQDRVRKWAASAPFGVGIIIAIPAGEITLVEAALEVACLEQMLRDPELIGKDPLVEVELRHLLDDARGYLHRAVGQLVAPQNAGPTFWHEGESIQPESAAELRSFLSGVIKKIYPLTPKINNELINRRRVSAPVANARKKLEMAILERAGLPGLGIQGNFPDASIFRTVLLNTGLYRQDNSEPWRFAQPEELKDRGLREVWSRLRAFFQQPSEGVGKSFATLFSELLEAPIGLRAGLLPVLVAASFRAFPAAVSLRREGSYVEDILPSVIEDICKRPALYSLEVLSLGALQNELVAAVYAGFADCDPGVTRQSDLIRTSFDCLRSWSGSLPPCARVTKKLSQAALLFRTAIAEQKDPVQLLQRDLPAIVTSADADGIASELRAIRGELEGVVNRTRREAAAAVRNILDVGLDRRDVSLADACQRWTKCFSILDLQRAGGSQAVSFIGRLEQRYDTDDLLVDSLASQLVGQPTSRWDDTTHVRFERALAEVVRAVEEEAVRLAVTRPENPVIVNNLSRLIEARLRGLYENLGKLRGEARARESLLRLAKSRQEKAASGNNSRSA
jgi:hypothetical protein